jgi:cytochrome c biogenesis protein CcdA/thiol-disulfide isomerase/thioredoxin
MAVLLVVAVLAGAVTALSPCVLPVLPVLAAGGALGGGRWRPAGIVAGMVVTFAAVTLGGSSLLSLVGLPQDLLRDLGIAALFVLGASLVVPPLGYLVERPFARLTPNRTSSSGNGLVLGASLGLVFVPCAGPVLAAITVVGATHRVGAESVAVTVCYSAGTALPMLGIIYLSRRAAVGPKALRRRAPRLRQVAGALIVASATLIVLGTLQPLQRDLPSYATALDARIDGSTSVAANLRKLTGEHVLQSNGAFEKDLPDGTNPALTDYGPAPRFLKIAAWLNTPGGRPLSMSALRGKVVLIDFWTYSCINCQREVPHLEAWYKTYRPFGLVVVGVHTPEFGFERDITNVRAAVHDQGITYPVAIDNSYLTWESYDNSQWPSQYLIDQTGQLRYLYAGEGNYGETETLVRDLLSANRQWLPPRTSVPDLTPGEQTTPETYLGLYGLQFYIGSKVKLDRASHYVFPPVIPLNYVSFQGVWDNNGADATSGPGAAIRLHFRAKDVYLVLGGHGSMTVLVGGRRTGTVRVDGYPRLFTLLTGRQVTDSTLQLGFTPGLSAYDFTFG